MEIIFKLNERIPSFVPEDVLKLFWALVTSNRRLMHNALLNLFDKAKQNFIELDERTKKFISGFLKLSDGTHHFLKPVRNIAHALGYEDPMYFMTFLAVESGMKINENNNL